MRPRKRKTSNPSAPATGEENSHSHANLNPTNVEATNFEPKVDPESNGSPTERKTSQDLSTLARRSDRLKRKREPVVRFNLVECIRNKSQAPAEIISEHEAPLHINSTMNAETTVHLDSNGSPPRKKTSEVPKRSGRIKTNKERVVGFNLVGFKRNKSPAPAEIISEQEALPHHNSTNMETTENIVHFDANGAAPRKKTSEVTKRSGRIKTNAGPAVRLNLVVRKKKASKGKQVSTLPSPTTKNSEQEAPSQVHQASDERNLLEKVDYIVQENISADDCPVTDTDYRRLYLASERRVEELMENNIELVKQLNFALGKVEAYEKMMGTMGFALNLSPQRGILPPTNAATAPDTSNHHQKVSSPKVRKNKKAIPDANDGHKASPTKTGKYKQAKA